MNIWFISSAAVGYLLGSLPFGYWVARAHGVDIFKVGSGNPGATNVKRTLGAKAGNTVLALDVAKGAIAT
ncbi:MAG: glycerol-3-phosphate acyltransferase, partial [Opitutae bacterium]|nr:glycerol-3-phosphate acyltransferase [Opitutae bacterium]